MISICQLLGSEIMEIKQNNIEREMNKLVGASTYVKCKECTEEVSVDQLDLFVVKGSNPMFYFTVCPACEFENECDDYYSLAYAFISKYKHLFKTSTTIGE